MFRIAICDEMQPQAAELARQLQSLAGEIPLECEVEIFHSFRQLQKALAENIYRMLILETWVGGVSGIDFGRHLRMTDGETDIVFCTADAESALAAYAVFPSGYLIKPADRKQLRDVFRRVADKYRQKPSIVLRGIDGGEHIVSVEDILYIEVFGTELDVHCTDGVLKCTGALNEAGSLLSSTDFYRCHRSFIVNLRHAVGIERYQFMMGNGDAVAVAKNRYTDIKSMFEAYVGVGSAAAGVPAEAAE